MKNLHQFYALLIIMSLLSCNATKPLDLKLDLPTNKKFKYKTTTTSDVSVKVMGQSQQTLSTEVQEMDYEVKNRKANGDLDMESTITAVSINQTTAMGSVIYDSKNPSKNSPPEQAAMYDAMLGQKFTYTMSSEGKVTSIKGADEMIDKMLGGTDYEAMGMEKAQMKEGIKAQFGDDAIKKMLGSFSQNYPEKPVKKGDSWSVRDTLSGTIGLIVNNTYTLTDRKAGKAYITVNGVLTPDPDAEGMEMMGMTMKYDLSGTSKGNVIINEATGWIDKSDIMQELKGKAVISGELVGTMETDMDMTTQTQSEIMN